MYTVFAIDSLFIVQFYPYIVQKILLFHFLCIFHQVLTVLPDMHAEVELGACIVTVTCQRIDFHG